MIPDAGTVPWSEVGGWRSWVQAGAEAEHTCLAPHPAPAVTGSPLVPPLPFCTMSRWDGFLAVTVLTWRSFQPLGLPMADLRPGSPAFRPLLLLAGQHAGPGRTGFFLPQPWLGVPVFLSSAGGPESVSPHSGALFMKSN